MCLDATLLMKIRTKVKRIYFLITFGHKKVPPFKSFLFIILPPLQWQTKCSNLAEIAREEQHVHLISSCKQIDPKLDQNIFIYVTNPPPPYYIKQSQVFHKMSPKCIAY